MSRKIDLSLFRGDDSDEDNDVPRPKPTVELDPLKSKTFSYGVTKKTKRDKEREAEERKRLEEEEATKAALEEFSRTFEGSGDGNVGPMGRRGWGSSNRGFVRAGAGAADVYNPLRDQAPPKPQPRSGPSLPSLAPPSPPPAPKPKGRRAMDDFLQEIKRNQEAREARLGKAAQRDGLSVSALEAFGGSAANRPAEVESTNVCIMNLPSTVSEAALGNLFADVGPVGTVKIMWPRGDSSSSFRRTQPPLTGFVCFMNRKDAEKAIRKYDGYDWNGTVLRATWGKVVPIPRKAAYVHHGRETGGRARSPPHRRATSPKLSPSASTRRRSLSPDREYTARDEWLQTVSEDERQFIKAVAERVDTHGPDFLAMLREREKENARFQFLTDQKSGGYHIFQYYLDPQYAFPDPPPHQFEDEGAASVHSSDSAEGSEYEKGKKTELGVRGRRRFEAMLRAMTGKRVEIARAMEFAVNRAEAAEELADIVCQSLVIDDTPIPRKIARLHLVSDILHNCSSPLPNVWRYRHAFEKRLLPVFAHFADVHKTLLDHTGTIAAAVFIQQADAVLDVWERWIIFTADVHDGLRLLLHGETTLEELTRPKAEAVAEDDSKGQTEFKSAGFKSSFKRIDPAASNGAATQNQQLDTAVQAPASTDDMDGEAIGDADGEPMGDVDGEPLGDVDGEEMGDLDGEAMGDVDGEAMGDVDGDAMDDVDGEAMMELDDEDM